MIKEYPDLKYHYLPVAFLARFLITRNKSFPYLDVPLPSLCTFMCRLQRTAVANSSMQYGHLNGRTELWIIMWRVREPLVVKVAWQMWQRKSFIPVCVLAWALRTPIDTKNRLHWPHL